jgi:3-phytase
MLLNYLLTICVISGSLGQVTTRPSDPDIAEVKQVWSSTGTHYSNTDSLAACPADNGRVRVFATAKDGHAVDVFDAETGRFVRRIGRRGKAMGEFGYPNGVVTVEFPARTQAAAHEPARHAFLVIERDNARVQAFWADNYQPAGAFGRQFLHRPYGAAVSYQDGAILLYVTDTEVMPADTVQVFRLQKQGNRITAMHVRSFGEDHGKGRILEAESVVVDDRLGRVLLCDEDPSQRDVKVYSLDGRFTGVTFGGDYVKREPEGIIVWEGPKGGCVVLTDQQKDLSVWHVFDRRDYRHIAAWTGDPVVANTDGICLYPKEFGPFKQGAFFAVHDDQDVRAYDWLAILAVLPTKLQGTAAVFPSAQPPDAGESAATR